MADVIARPHRPGAAPSPDAVQAFYELFQKGASASSQRRFLRAAEYFGRAASAARALCGENGGHCVVHALLWQSGVLIDHLQTSGSLDGAMWLEAQRLVAECRRILNARLSANTCLVGRCFAVEEDFFARYALIMAEVAGLALNPNIEALAQSMKGEVGCDACMTTAVRGFAFVYPGSLFGPAHPRIELNGVALKEAQTFVLRCVGNMSTARHSARTSERKFAEEVRDLLASDRLELPFKADLARAWERPALQNALRARGVFEEKDLAIRTKFSETLEKKVAADREKHGLRWCALPSCAKQETHVFDFKACSACKAVVYCSAEHGALHWSQSHRKECASLKAAGAKPRSTADAGEGEAAGSVADVD